MDIEMKGYLYGNVLKSNWRWSESIGWWDSGLVNLRKQEILIDVVVWLARMTGRWLTSSENVAMAIDNCWDLPQNDEWRREASGTAARLCEGSLTNASQISKPYNISSSSGSCMWTMPCACACNWLIWSKMPYWCSIGCSPNPSECQLLLS